jgi:hypothetical protein
MIRGVREWLRRRRGGDREAGTRAHGEGITRYALGWVVSTGIVAGLVLLVLAEVRPEGNGAPPPAPLPSGDTTTLPERHTGNLERAAETGGCELRTDPSEGFRQVDRHVRYRANPPTSGDHSPEPAADGAYTEAPPTESLVHSLARGRVVIHYRPTLPRPPLALVKALYAEDDRQLILTPNSTDMPYAVAATAWRRSLGCSELTPRAVDAIRAFRDRYRDRAPRHLDPRPGRAPAPGTVLTRLP